MRVDTIAATLDKALESGLIDNGLEILWHCGEPLSLPMEIYTEYFHTVRRKLDGITSYSFSIQTNGTLLTEDWCSFLSSWDVKIGISLDGPRDLHDQCRKDRRGRGTFDATMRGVRLLQDNGIPFYVICVLHRASLDRWNDLYSFFVGSGIEKVCFNVEEIDGANSTSSLSALGNNERVTEFFYRYFSLLENGGGHWLREYEHSLRALFAKELCNSMVSPFEMLTVDHDGNYATYSPEVLNAQLASGERFRLGNVHDHGTSLLKALECRQEWASAIDRGVDLCRKNCSYFEMCGGGSPSNKLAEHGTFEATETVYCRFGTQAPMNAMVKHLQERLRAATAPK